MRELARLFTRLGFTAFGGPAAHIAMMEDEVVAHRGWMTRQHFLDLVGATNLIPGPNSTQMVLHTGYERRGWLGQIVAGVSFIFPAALTTGLLGWLYVEYGSLPQVEPYLVGIKPAVLAIILSAVWRLGRTAIKGWRLAVLGAAVVVAALLGVNEILLLFTGAIVGALWLRLSDRLRASAAVLALLPSTPALAGTAGGVSLGKLFLAFLKIGAILYGSGYILVAFLEATIVEDYAWLTEQQLLDVTALGQLTPGPVLTTATVVGYIVAGVGGAVVATVAIFLPSFLLVPLLNPVIPKLRRSPWASAFLDAVNVTAVALMAVVLAKLGRASLVDWSASAIFLIALVALRRFRISSPWVVIGAALLGYLAQHWR